jgi:hypothetical protein
MSAKRVVRLLVVVLLLLASAGAHARDWYGVDLGAVPWPEVCRGTTPVPVERGLGRCEVSHPASLQHGEWRKWPGMADVMPPGPICGQAMAELERWTAPGTVGDPWRECRYAWAEALKERAREPERFREPFAEWRQQYFGRWLTDGEGPAVAAGL